MLVTLYFVHSHLYFANDILIYQITLNEIHFFLRNLNDLFVVQNILKLNFFLILLFYCVDIETIRHVSFSMDKFIILL